MTPQKAGGYGSETGAWISSILWQHCRPVAMECWSWAALLTGIAFSEHSVRSLTMFAPSMMGSARLNRDVIAISAQAAHSV